MRKFMVTIDGNQYEVGVEEITEGGEVVAAPVKQIVKTEAPKAAPKAVAANGTKMESPMPGMIKSLAKKNGDTVKKGDVVLVLEAMKMDNDLNAPCDGVITYSVTVGANVETGAVLCVIG